MSISVMIDETQLSEIFKRTRGQKPVQDVIWTAIQNWLDLFDEESQNSTSEMGGSQAPTPIPANDFGAPALGYYWQSVFLANGTRLKMTYKGEDHLAEVRHQQIWYNGRVVHSPSQWASDVADGTARNAWRDISIYRPLHKDWIPASMLRQRFIRKARF
jgi:hypothetical protein